MTKKQKKMLYRIIAALALVLVLKLLPPLPVSVELLLYCIPYLVVAGTCPQGPSGHQEPSAL
mgnify:CR=1 FL=1